MWFEKYFLTGDIPANAMTGTYSFSLVILSYLVAVCASYIALDLTGRLRDPSSTKAANLFWLMGGAVAMGCGIWSMHFIGMLSFNMPEMTAYYDSFYTGLSLLVAIIASGFALFLLKTKTLHVYQLVMGGVILGFSIAAMHYTGMAAMEVGMVIKYIPSLFLLSIIIAIFASEAALWLAIKSNQVVAKMRVRLKMVSAVIMGVAICGMHYTGMAAAIFLPTTEGAIVHGGLNPTILSISIAGITFLILAIAFFASNYKEAVNQQRLEHARQLGMAEVSASVLHSVGNVLNSVNVSANLINEEIANSKLSELSSLKNLFNQHRDHLGDFLTKDQQGEKSLRFFNLLCDRWTEDQKKLIDEITLLRNNLQYIKEIISVQQGLSKVTELEQLVSLNDIIDEALLISGVNSSKNFIVEKSYACLKPLLIDKVKLLQIFVNILSNAKEAIKNSNNTKKTIMVHSVLEGNKIKIEFTDNGVGIQQQHLSKIFNYGFTTKETGHGFGLHTAALDANEMGGALSVKSLGLGKGATFILEIPYKIKSE